MDLQSILGYSQGSPFSNNPYLDINTPEGLIDMSNTPTDLVGIDEMGNKQVMKARRKKPYKFKGKLVREIPIAQLGKIIPQATGDIPQHFNGQIPQASQLAEMARMGNLASHARYADLKNTIAGQLRSDNELKKLAEKAPSTWSSDLRNAVSYNKWRDERVTQHPDYDPNIPVDQQYSLNEDNSLRTRVLRGRNIFMGSSSGNPLVDFTAKALASPASSFANMTMDAENQYAKPGWKKGLGNFALDATNVFPQIPYKAALALHNGVPMIEKGLENLGEFVIDKAYVPLRYRNQIKNLKNVHAQMVDNLTSSEGTKRLLEIGIDPSLVKNTSPKLSFKSFIGSHFSSYENNINIDFPQLKRFKNENIMLNSETVYQHEYAHKLQFDKEITSLAKKNMNALEEHLGITKHGLNDAELLPDNTLSNTLRKIDLGTGYAYNKLDNFIYYNHGSYGKEPFAFLREMRQNMKNKGYIKNVYEPISGKTIMKFMKENPTDRISSFADIDPENISILKNAMNTLPSATIPVAGVVAAGVASKKGNNPYQQGGSVQEILKYIFEDDNAPATAPSEEDIQQQQQDAPDERQQQREADDREQEMLAMQIAMDSGANPYKPEYNSFSSNPHANKGSVNPYAKQTQGEILSLFPEATNLGIWGDAAHQARKSDHNTGDAQDFGVSDPSMGDKIAEKLKAEAKKRNVKYIIFNKRIWNPSISDSWRPYTGSNPHTTHVHVSYNR